MLRQWAGQVPSPLLVVLVYLALKWYDLRLSSFFTLTALSVFLLLVILVQLIAHYLGSHRLAIVRDLGKGICLLVLVNFLSVILADSLNRWQLLNLSRILVSGVLFSVVFFLLLAFLTYRVKGWVYIQNVFLLILFLVVMAGQLADHPVDFQDHQPLVAHPRHVDMAGSEGGGPVLLIVLDEYSSSEQMARVMGDSSFFNVNKALESKGWKTMEMRSLETSTIHSLTSIFNFNLSEDTRFSKMSDYKASEQGLMKCMLHDSLRAKGVTVVNRGIVDLGPERAYRRLYFYPRNFFELVLRHTVIRTLMTGKPYPYNRALLDQLPAEVGANDNDRRFFYVHLFMPHPPFAFGDEFPSRDITQEHYAAYRKFTDGKLLALLEQLTAEQQAVRIIVTGDHGYRRGNMDDTRVFAAFYGFDDHALANIRSVQDLGSLANACFAPGPSFRKQ